MNQDQQGETLKEKIEWQAAHDYSFDSPENCRKKEAFKRGGEFTYNMMLGEINTLKQQLTFAAEIEKQMQIKIDQLSPSVSKEAESEDERWYCAKCHAPLILKKNNTVEDESKLRCHDCYVKENTVGGEAVKEEKGWCVSCEEEKVTHELCMECALKIGRDNPPEATSEEQTLEEIKELVGEICKTPFTDITKYYTIKRKAE